MSKMVMSPFKTYRLTATLIFFCLIFPGLLSAQIEETLSAETDNPPAISLSSAIIMALENNTEFRAERLTPNLYEADEQIQRSAYDPVLSATVSHAQTRDKTEDSTGSEKSDTGTLDSVLSVTENLPTGTNLQVDIGHTRSSTDDTVETEYTETYLSGTITQSLLRGRGPAVNLVALRKAKLSTRISLFELQGTAEALVGQVASAYWDYILSDRSIEIYERSLKIAEQQVAEVRERIRVGKIAETELVAVEAEMASRREQLINARGTLVKNRLNLLRLLNIAETGAEWQQTLELSDSPEITPVRLDGADHFVDQALEKRADINQARLEIQQGDLDIIRTKNGLLPKLDLFMQIKGSRYADEISGNTNQDIDETSFSIGAGFEFPIPNREARALHKKAVLNQEQTSLAIHNMKALIQVDVRSAYVDVQRAAEQINATSATRKLREKNLIIEREKLRLGRSTSFLISQAQRDLVASQITEVESIVNYRKALLALQQASGVLLENRGITLN